MERLRAAIFGFTLGALSIVACSGSEESGSSAAPADGTERGSCRSDGTCDPGLVCLSRVCVDPGSASDASSTGGVSAAGASGGIAGSGGGGTGGSSGSGAASGGQGGAGGAVAAGGQGGGAAGAGGAGPVCTGSHPNVDGARRFCDSGDCYCTEPFDTCFPADQIGACCTGTADCGSDAGAGGVECTSQHPIIGPPRTCEPGNCLCSDASAGVDACFPEAVARVCCPPNIEIDCVPQ